MQRRLISIYNRDYQSSAQAWSNERQILIFKMKEEIKKMIRELHEIMKKECKSSVIWVSSAYEEHILLVIKYSKMLAKKLNADEEIVEISALLHDITILRGDKLNHHNSGPIEAEKILKEFNYPQEKIEKVKHCINAHRGSQKIKRETVEAECVASADGMSHFDVIPRLLLMGYDKTKDRKEALEWTKSKLERSWNKLIPEAKEIVRNKYEAWKIISG